MDGKSLATHYKSPGSRQSLFGLSVMNHFSGSRIREVWVEPNEPCLDNPRRIEVGKQHRDLICVPQTTFVFGASFHLSISPTRNRLGVFHTRHVSDQPPTQKPLQGGGHILKARIHSSVMRLFYLHLHRSHRLPLSSRAGSPTIPHQMPSKCHRCATYCLPLSLKVNSICQENPQKLLKVSKGFSATEYSTPPGTPASPYTARPIPQGVRVVLCALRWSLRLLIIL